jgi:hypothetical protein
MTTWNDDIDRLAREQITHGDEKIDAFRKGFHAATVATVIQAHFPFPMQAFLRNPAELEAFLVQVQKLRMFPDDSCIIDWLQRHTTLHRDVELAYVVDGYEVTITHDCVPIAGPWRGKDLRSALTLAMANWNQGSGR